MINQNSGKYAYELAELLWPLNRTLISEDTKKTLKILLSSFEQYSKVYKYKSGTKFGDWTIPQAWNVKEGYISDLEGSRIVDWENNNLHLLNYSESVNSIYSIEELKKHLYFDSNQPDWIPYRTSYYSRDWGFCLSMNQLSKLTDFEYKVVINSSFSNSDLEVGEIYIPGESSREVVFTSYICHPSMANNELSGPVVLNALAQELIKNKTYYSYRFLFMPETIGAIAFINTNFEDLKKNVLAGYIVTCVGDSRGWSYIPSRNGKTLADVVALRVLDKMQINYRSYSFLDRGSDERQFCSPLVDLPFCSIARSKYGTYPEYHTSGDDMKLISANALQASIEYYWNLIAEFEANRVFQPMVLGEPMFLKHSLRGGVGGKNLNELHNTISNIVAFSDTTRDITEIAKLLSLSIKDISAHCEELANKGILTQL